LRREVRFPRGSMELKGVLVGVQNMGNNFGKNKKQRGFTEFVRSK
jgi:hypothetical protein